jgi:hypothetical protein
VYQWIINCIVDDVHTFAGKDIFEKDSPWIPSYPFPAVVTGGAIQTSSGFFENVRSKRIDARKGVVIERFLDENHVLLSNGETLEADLIVCATGQHFALPFFGEEIMRELRCGMLSPPGTVKLALYRFILPPTVPNLAFNGYADLLFTLSAHTLTANWISDVFLGEIDLPSQSNMLAIAKKTVEWIFELRYNPNLTFMEFAYIDPLLTDMKVSVYRAGHFVSEYFATWNPTRLAGIQGERCIRRLTGKAPNLRYFSLVQFLVLLFVVAVAMSITWYL